MVFKLVLKSDDERHFQDEPHQNARRGVDAEGAEGRHAVKPEELAFLDNELPMISLSKIYRCGSNMAKAAMSVTDVTVIETPACFRELPIRSGIG